MKYASITVLCVAVAFVGGCGGTKKVAEPKGNTASEGFESNQAPNFTSKIGDGTERGRPQIAPPTNSNGPIVSSTPPMSTMPGSHEATSESRYHPPVLKPDETVTGSYAIQGGGKVEVASIAKITEDSIRCWTPSGSRDTAMEAKIQKCLSGHENMGSQGFTFQYGKKNRVIIFKTTIPARDSSGGWVNIQQVGESMNGGYTPLYRLNENSRFDPNSPRVNYEARSIAVDSGTSKTTALLNVTQRVKETATLSLRAGSKCTLGGMTAKVKSISPFTPSKDDRRMGMYGGGDRKMWKVDMEMSGTGLKGMLNFGIDSSSSGSGFSGIDKDGKPISRTELTPPRPGSNGPTTRGPRVPYMMSPSLMPYYSPNRVYKPGKTNTMTYLLNIDPKYVSRILVTGHRQKLVRLKGIPLF